MIEVNNKFELGQEVWYMQDNVPKKSIVRLINITCGSVYDRNGIMVPTKHEIYYTVEDTHKDLDLYPTKEALIRAVFENTDY